MKRCVVNFASGGVYPQGQARLRRQCERYGIDFIGHDVVPCGFAPHEFVPYAFKAACVRDALNKGYETVCWADASANFTRHPGPIFDEAEKHGAFVASNYGFRNGQWASDACLMYLGVSRERAWETEHCSALVCAFCPSSGIIGGKLWEEYERAARDEIALVGPHTYSDQNRPETSPGRPPVSGHRHDQTVLSLLAVKYGVPFHENKEWLDYGRDRTSLVAAYPWEAIDG